MKVVYKYSKTQLNDAVAFISKNNHYFLGMTSRIELAILDEMKNLSKKFPQETWTSTMGFTIQSELLSEEDLDYNNNTLLFTILVDPSVSNQDRFIEEDCVSNIITI